MRTLRYEEWFPGREGVWKLRPGQREFLAVREAPMLLLWTAPR